MKSCFIISPLDTEESNIRIISDTIYNKIFFPVLQELHYDNVSRSDKINQPGSLQNQIMEKLVMSNIVIADISENNPNVMYELGIRHAQIKPTIIVKRKNTSVNIPFDIAAIRIIYIDMNSSSFVNEKQRLKDHIIYAEKNPESASYSMASYYNDYDKGKMVNILSGIENTSSNVLDKKTTQNLEEPQDVLEFIIKEINMMKDYNKCRIKGNEYFKNKKYIISIMYYNKSLDLKSDDISSYIHKGNALYRLSNYSEAYTCFTNIIDIDPSIIEVYVSQGDALLAMGKFNESLVCYDKAIELDVAYIIAYIRKARSLAQLNRIDESLVCYDKVIELEPTYIIAHLAKGILLLNHNKLDVSLACFDKALKLDPNEITAYAGKCNILYRKNKFHDVIKYCKLMVKLDPKYEEAYILHAMALFRIMDFENAINFHKKVLELNPNQSHSYVGIARIYIQMYDDVNALKFYDYAIKIDPNNPLLYVEKGLFFTSKLNFNAAINCFDKALDCNINNKFAIKHKQIVLDLQRAYLDDCKKWNIMKLNIPTRTSFMIPLKT